MISNIVIGISIVFHGTVTISFAALLKLQYIDLVELNALIMHNHIIPIDVLAYT